MAGVQLKINGVAVNPDGTITITLASLGAGAAATLGTNVAGGVPVLDSNGLLPAAQLPPLAITSVQTASSQSAMLALTAQQGDVAIRTDMSNSAFMLTASDPTQIGNWTEISQGLAVALQALSGLTPAADTMPYFTGQGSAATTLISAGARQFLSLTTIAQMQQALGLSKVASSGAYGDLTGVPPLGSAASHAVTEFATSAQGVRADNAVQPNTSPTLSGLSISGPLTTRYSATDTNPSLEFSSSGNAQGEVTSFRFRGTFNGTADNGPRPIGGIKCYFNGGTGWGSETFDFMVNGNGTPAISYNDNGSFANMYPVLRLTRSYAQSPVFKMTNIQSGTIPSPSDLISKAYLDTLVQQSSWENTGNVIINQGQTGNVWVGTQQNWGLLPMQDNYSQLGSGPNRWSNVFAATGAVNTSDAREKTTPLQFTDTEIAAAVDLAKNVQTYKWLASIQAKGEADARTHIGMTVQQAMAIMQSHGLDPFAYGFICYDKWDAVAEVKDDAGNVTTPSRTAGDRYSFRMDELSMFIARGQQKIMQDQADQLAALVARVAALEAK